MEYTGDFSKGTREKLSPQSIVERAVKWGGRRMKLFLIAPYDSLSVKYYL